MHRVGRFLNFITNTEKKIPEDRPNSEIEQGLPDFVDREYDIYIGASQSKEITLTYTENGSQSFKIVVNTGQRKITITTKDDTIKVENTKIYWSKVSGGLEESGEGEWDLNAKYYVVTFSVNGCGHNGTLSYQSNSNSHYWYYLNGEGEWDASDSNYTTRFPSQGTKTDYYFAGVLY